MVRAPRSWPPRSRSASPARRSMWRMSISMRNAAPALCLAALLAGCGGGAGAPAKKQPEQQYGFPAADRPVATIVSARWSNEEARDRLNEAEAVMNRAGIKPGMTVADIGAGEGYYTIRLAPRGGKEGRVLAEDIVPEVRDALATRVSRERVARG